jgi:VWFA-related protein
MIAHATRMIATVNRMNRFILAATGVLLLLVASVSAQDGKPRGIPKPVTVPVSIRLRDAAPVEMRIVDFLLREDGDIQQEVSRRTPMDSPMTLAVLFQDDLVSSAAVDMKNMANFIGNQPGGSRVMVAYIRQGSLDVRKRFTNELDKAAESVRAPQSLASASAYNPYVEIIEGLKRFDSQPMGRRAMIVVSHGIDVSRGADSSNPGQSIDLQRAINEAQRRAVAIYSIFVPPAAPTLQSLNLNGQSCLQRLSAETGGQAFFQGTAAPVSFDPFLKEIDLLMSRQLALTYRSTHTNKGFHKLDIKPLEKDVEIRHPAGYTR